MTDDECGVENLYQYDAFGVVREKKERIENRITYTGQQYDGITGQYYVRARYYNPVLGRFLQEDVYRGDGLNLYAYCDNNSVIYYDPSGYAKKKESYPDLSKINGDGGANTTESPALKDSPYNPDIVDSRIKPEYTPNPAHDSSSSLYNPKKTPEPIDSRDVYNNSVRGGMGEWYGVNDSGDIYQFFYDNNGGVHFAGTISKETLAKKNYDVIKLLEISMKGK